MFPIFLRLGSFNISTYGVAVAAAYLIGIYWLKTQIRHMPKMTEEKFWPLIYALFFGAVLGGKLLYVAVNFEDYVSGEMSLIGDFRYGFVFFGGVLGAVLMGAWYVRRIKVSFWATADYFGVAIPLGHWLGRLGCLAAGCCHGRPTDLPWGLVARAHPASNTPAELWGMSLHPTQLYESAADIFLAFYLLYHLLPLTKKKKLAPGTVFLAYAFLYSAVRFIIEFYRGDDRGWSLMSLWVSQWIALGVMASAAVLMYRRGVRHKA